MADLQMVEDRTIRLQVIVDGEIHTCSWINIPKEMEGDDDYYTGWYYDEEDIPFFLANTAQAAAYMLRKELGKRGE